MLGFLQRELTVEREAGLQRDEWFLRRESSERNASLSRCASSSCTPLTTSIPADRKTLEAAAFRRGIRILHRSNDALDARGDDRFGAWTGAAGVIARFERDVERRALRFCSGGFERDDFRVIALLVLMKSLTDDFAVAHNDATDRRIRAGEADAFAREVERVVHEANVV